MGVINITPFFGDQFGREFGENFVKYFPISVIFFALLNAIDFYTWLMVKMGFPQLSFTDNFDKSRQGEGKSLVLKGKGYVARSEQEKGISNKFVFSENPPIRAISLSNTKSRYEEIRARIKPLESPLNS